MPATRPETPALPTPPSPGDEDGADPTVAAEGAPTEVLRPPAPPGSVEPSDALTRYMAELRHHAPISREEEHELAVRWVRDGDPEAARQLVLSNLRLVVKIAFEYRRAWANTLDLIQEGNVGLAQAVQRFDPYQGTRLASYAAYWIRAHILKYLIDNIRLVRLGKSRAQRKLFFRLNKEKRELERQGFKPAPKLIAERLDVSEEDVLSRWSNASPSRELSLDTPVSRATTRAARAVFGDLRSTRRIRRCRRATSPTPSSAACLHGDRCTGLRGRPSASGEQHHRRAARILADDQRNPTGARRRVRGVPGTRASA